MSDEQDYKDYQDYLAYQQHISGASPAPQAEAPNDPMEAYRARHANDSIGQKLKSIAIGDSDNPTVQGMPPMVIPGGGAVAAAGKFAEAAGDAGKMSAAAPEALQGVTNVMNKVGQSALGRIGMGTAQGGIGGFASGPIDKSLDERLTSAKHGALLGGAIGTAAEGVGKLADWLKPAARKMARLSPSQADAYVSDPKGVQAAADNLEDGSAGALLQKSRDAQDAIQNSRRGLRAEGLGKAQRLAELIKGKSATINPAEWQGLSPELDEAIQSQANAYNQLPQEVEVPLDALQAAKRAAQAQANFKPGTVYDATQSAKMAEMGSKASKLRQMVEDVVPEAKDLNGEMQQNVLLGKDLRSALKNPLSSTSTSNPDKLAKLALTDSASGGGGLFNYASKQGAAKAIAAGDVGSGVTGVPIRYTAKQMLRATHGAGQAVKSDVPQMALVEILRRAFQGK